MTLFFGAGLWQLNLIWGPSYDWLTGRIGVFAGPVLLVCSLPIAALAPFFFAFFKGWWLPLGVGAGGMISAAVLWVLGEYLASRAEVNAHMKDHGRATARIFRFRPLARVVLGAGFVFCLGMICLLCHVFLDGSRLLALVLAPVFAWAAAQTWRECRRVWSYRVVLGPSWVRCHVAGEEVVITFADMSTYLEAPLRFRDGEFGGYQFILKDVHNQTIHFSTQIVGWAALHEALHAARPELIPRARDTSARSRVGIGKVPMTVDAAMLTAAGQDIPEEWNHPSRVRWYDVVIGYALGLGTAVLLSVSAVRPLDRVLNGWGVPWLLRLLPSLLLVIWLAMFITQRYVTSARRTRLRRTRRQNA